MEFETIASGLKFLEAPRWDGKNFWFADLLGGGLYRWRGPGQELEQFLPERTYIGGIAFNDDGALILGGRGGLAWFHPETGQSGMLLDRLDGVPIEGTNDMLPDGQGGLIFGTFADGPVGETPNALVRLRPDGSTSLLTGGLKFANGIGLSPGGTRLYHNESLVGTSVYTVDAGGRLGPGRIFCAQTDCDGLAVDAQGNVWSAYFDSGEIAAIRPDGTLMHKIPLPQKTVISLCFGGEDLRDLYVVTGGHDGVAVMLRGGEQPGEACVYRGRSEIPGLQLPRTAFKLPLA